MIGTATSQSPHSPISMSSEAKAYNISENETNINELTKYYTQRHLTFSNKWLWQKDNGTIHATLLQLSWFSHIQVFGPESWGNINQLRNKYVDIFALKDYETWRTYMLAQETFTGGVTPVAKPKPVLTLKEVDFRIRQTLIKNKKLYNGDYNKGHIKITGGSNNYTIDLSKRLKSTDANRYVKNPQTAHIEILLEKSS